MLAPPYAMTSLLVQPARSVLAVARAASARRARHERILIELYVVLGEGNQASEAKLSKTSDKLNEPKAKKTKRVNQRRGDVESE